jgi:NADH-quinone oxidoreductase subunit C
MVNERAAENPLVRSLQEESPTWLVAAKIEFDELTVEVLPDRITHVCRFLKENHHFERLSSVTGVDRFPQEPRLEVVYHLHSFSKNRRVRVKTRVSTDNPELESMTAVWPGANWYEREVFDLFGVVFRNHPNLRRILMPDFWEGHPLRKDYPTHGYKYSYKEEGATS